MNALRLFSGQILTHSIWGVALFAAFLGVIFFLFTRPYSTRALTAAGRLFWTGISTPFVFVRRSFEVIEGASAAEQSYIGTREFVLFRYSRIQYLLVAVFSIVYLASAATVAFFTFYPSAEIARASELRTQINSLEKDIAATNENISNASKPTYKASLEALRAKALQDFQRQYQDDQQFRGTVPFSGPMRTQIESASTEADLAQLKGQLDSYFADCPTGVSWNNFTVATCAQFKAFLSNLADRRTSEANLVAAYNGANKAVNDAQSALLNFQNHLLEDNTALSAAKSEYDAVTISNGKWIAPHMLASLLASISAVIGFIVVVWTVSMLIDVFNWLIMMMRSLERRHSEEAEPPQSALRMRA